MTFILNILHKDMSILAGDKKVVAEWPSILGFPSRGKAVAHDCKKITTNLTSLMAIGASGYSEYNSYIKEIERSDNINNGLSIIRYHMERFLLIDNLPSLIKASSPFLNECIVSFYDKKTETYFTNECEFNEFRNKTHLHRASERIKVFCAGSGKAHFEIASAIEEVNSLSGKFENSNISDTFIPWMKDAFRKVSAKDEGYGAEGMFAVSTRESPEFRLIENC